MRKVNFHTLDNLTVPPELMEKALAIPHAAVKPERIRRTRMLAAAASVVLVALAGVIIYFAFGNKSPAVRPSSSTTELIGDTVDTTVPTGSETSDPRGTSNTGQPQPTGVDARSGAFGSTHTVDPSVSYPSGSTPTAPVETLPTGADLIAPGTSATAIPAPTAGRDDETQAPIPTDSSTEQPVEQSTEAPTDPPDASPQIPPSDNPGASPMPGDPGNVAVSSAVNSRLLTGNKHVFCVLYDSADHRVDSEPILSPKHETIPTIRKDGYAYFVYRPPKEWNLQTGIYKMEVYNEDGQMIQSKNVYLMNE